MEIFAFIIVFFLGFGVGGIYVKRQWKNNAKDFMGIDGYKVITIEFYDSEIYLEYVDYLGSKS
jgi:hypothetical protein